MWGSIFHLAQGDHACCLGKVPKHGSKTRTEALAAQEPTKWFISLMSFACSLSAREHYKAC